MAKSVIEHPLLDGSLVPYFRERFASRIARLIRYAAESKRQAIGVMSLPEIDGGLARLAGIFKQLAPNE